LLPSPSSATLKNMSTELRDILLSRDPVGVLRTLKSTGKLKALEPSLVELNMKVPAGYHHKDNWVHSLEVLQNAIDRETAGPDLILRTAALFHDIGKPATREFGAKGEVTFTNHDVVGARMVRKSLPRHGFTRAEVDAVSRLVFMHMRSHTFAAGWTDSAVRRLITDAGSVTQLTRLIVIFFADTTTKVPGKKKNLHAKVQALSEELARVDASDARAALRPALNGVEVAELLGLTPGPELGKVMKFLNKDENIGLTREETVALLLSNK
jgi:poly(A) polymerase